MKAHHKTLRATVPTATAMRSWGARFAKVLRGGDVLLLHGVFGAGKTTLVQGIARGLGLRRRVTSPTFVLAQPYRIRRGTLRVFVHADLYRLKPNEVRALGLEDIAGRPDSIVAIEWPSRLAGQRLPGRRVAVSLAHDKHGRCIRVRWS